MADSAAATTEPTQSGAQGIVLLCVITNFRNVALNRGKICLAQSVNLFCSILASLQQFALCFGLPRKQRLSPLGVFDLPCRISAQRHRSTSLRAKAWSCSL